MKEREGQKLKLAASFVSGGIKRRSIRREDGTEAAVFANKGRRLGDDRASDRAERWTPAAARRRTNVTFPVHSSLFRLQ